MISQTICRMPFHLGDLLEWPAAVYPQKPALEWEGGSLTYTQLQGAVRERASCLAALGASHGRHWGLLLGNSPDFTVSLLALLKIGCVAVPLRCHLPEEKLAAHIRLTALDGVLTCREMERPLNRRDWGKATEISPGLNAFAASAPRALKPSRNLIDLDPALILLTSGSTGRSRGVVLQHHAVLANLLSNIAALGLRDDDRTLVVLPLSHAYALIHQCLCHLMIGATVCLAPSPLVGAVLHRYLESFAITTVSTAPPVLRVLVSGLERSKAKLPELRLVTVGAAFADRQTVQEFRRLLPKARLAVTYGLTEAGPRVATHFVEPDEDFTPECVGNPLPNVAVDLRELGDGRQELVVRSRSAMVGYIEGAEVHARPAGERLPTGDTGYLQDGRIHLKGRTGRVINRGGVLVGAEQVESVLLAHPAISAARVEAEKHDFWGEVPVAAVTPAPGGKRLDEEQLKEYCAARLSVEERPFRFVISAPLREGEAGESDKNRELATLIE